MDYQLETQIVHGDGDYDSRTGAVSFPIYQTATFRHRGFNQSTGFDYTREHNPTRHHVEKAIAVLEGGAEGYAFATGMAAIGAVLDLFGPGDHLIVSNDLYGGTYRIFENLGVKRGLTFSYLDTGAIEEIEAGITANTKAIFVETPTNPTMKVSDLKQIGDLCRRKDLLFIVDNTFLTPYFQRPLALGAHVVVHSGTKFLGGHNDTLSGLVVLRETGALAEELRLVQKTTGGVLSPFDSWLLLRGMKTLGIRMERQEQNALEIAKWLCSQPTVEKVYYPGLEDHEGYEISKKQATGFGSMISFTLKETEQAIKILNGVRLITFAESLGGVESLITYPLTQTHAAVPRETLERLGINDRLLRLSVGIESSIDLIKELGRLLND